MGDAINNSVTKPPWRKTPAPLTRTQLVDEIKALGNRVRGLVYCQRSNTDNISSDLKSLGIPVLDIVNDFISKKEQGDAILVDKYSELHLQFTLEYNLLKAVVNNN